MATIQKRGKSYLISTSCGYNSAGKQIRKSITWKPEPNMTARQEKKAVEAAAVRFEDQVASGRYIDQSITLDNFIDRWISDYASINLRANTNSGYKVELSLIRAALGHIKLCKLQPHHIIEFLKNLSEDGVRRDGKYKPLPIIAEAIKNTGKTNKQLAAECGLSETIFGRAINPKYNVSYKTAKTMCDFLNLKIDKAYQRFGKNKLSGNTILHYYHLLQSIFSTAVEWQVIPSNPCDRVKAPHKDEVEQSALSVEESQRLITCLESESILHRSAVLLLLYSGARRSEIYGLEWQDVNLDTLQISINKTWQRVNHTWQSQPCKTKKSMRVVALPECCRSLFAELRASQTENKLKCGSYWKNSPALLLKEDGDHASPYELTAWFRKFCRKNNFPEEIHIHSMRHTNATLQIASHLDIRSVSSRLGHSQASTTLNIYAHAIQSADAKAAEVLGDLLNTKKAE